MNCFTFSAELNAKTAEAESEESLEKSKHKLLQAQVLLAGISFLVLFSYLLQVESLQIQLNKRQREMKGMKAKLV